MAGDCHDDCPGDGRPGQPVPLDDCEGLVSKEFIYIYPPGIPIVAPGEVLKPELVDEIRKYKRKGLPVQGTADPEVGSGSDCGGSGKYGE